MKESKIKAKLLMAMLALLWLAACNKPALYDKVKEPGDPWPAHETLSFTVDINDTLSPFNFLISVRNKPDYRYANLFLFLHTYFPDGRMSHDTINLWLADAAGHWLGKGMGHYRDRQILFKSKGRFPMKGRYRFAFEQAMRTPRLKGIKSVGIRIEKSKE